MYGRTTILFAAVVLASIAPVSARGDEVPICMPVPSDYRISLDVDAGSAFQAADALACLGGLYLVRGEGARDAALTLAFAKPLPWTDALAEANKALAPLCLKMRADGKRLALDHLKGRRKACKGPAQAGAPVRAVLKGFERTALITTSAPPCPPRSILNEPDRVTEVSDKHYALSIDIRTLAERDPMAFISEGAAFPTLFGFPAPGFILTYVRKGGVLDRAGLQVGDVLMMINGIRLRSIPEAFEAYGMLQGAPILAVQVKRLGETLTLIYEFK